MDTLKIVVDLVAERIAYLLLGIFISILGVISPAMCQASMKKLGNSLTS